MTANDQIRDLVASFAADLEALVRQAALEQVQAVLAIGALPAATRKVAKKTTRKASKKAAKETGGAKRGRRGSVDKDALAASALAYIRANQPAAMGDLAKATGGTPVQLRTVLQDLAANGEVHSTGARRGTRYHAGKGGSGAGVPEKAAARKKATRKKKAGGKKAAKRSTKRAAA